MNKDFLFLKNLYTLIEAGYSIEDSLSICQNIFNHPSIQIINQKLQEGERIENILMSISLSKLFCEYFSFFQNKNCLSEAIKKSLKICMIRQEYQNTLKSKLTYPLLLLAFLFLFSLFVVFVLLPNVNNLFLSFQIEKTLLIRIMFMFFYIMPILLIGTCIVFIYIANQLRFALKKKKFRIIERYLRLPIFKICLQKYFSLKFAMYFNELLKEEMDSASIITLLNEQMVHSDLKIVLYEMYGRMNNGESIEKILCDFEYLDPLFISFFQMYIRNPTQQDSLQYYIDLTYEQIDLYISQILKYLIPSIYGFVAIFVITIYISIILPMMNVISEI